jgi:hypothetical protein
LYPCSLDGESIRFSAYQKTTIAKISRQYAKTKGIEESSFRLELDGWELWPDWTVAGPTPLVNGCVLDVVAVGEEEEEGGGAH